MEPGFFQLRNAHDLLAKLEVELAQFQQRPAGPYRAFNFFVTAEHLPDWIDNKEVRKQNVLLRICSHLANGAKHFSVNRHHSVADTKKGAVFEEDVFEEGVFEEWLIVYLEPDEANMLGYSKIRATLLAEKILSWWKNYLA